MDSFLETMKNLGPARLAVMLMTFFGLILFFIFIAVKSSNPALTLLYGGLSAADSTEIAAKLGNARITYSLSEDGSKISVPSKDVGKSRMLLAAEGLPRQGSVGYEIFDQKQSFGTTSFVQNINQVRALEGELARTIGTMDQIKSARVHLVLPQRELFSRETRPSTASVFLNLRTSSLGQEQIRAVQHLVAAAVPGLKASNVAIIDQSGSLLARGEEDESTASVSSAAELKQKYESRLSRSIEDMIGRIVGYGKVRANVTAEMNFDVVSRNSESYNPDGQVVRSTQSTSEENIDNSGAASSGVTVANNLPGLPGGGAAGGGETSGSKNTRTEEVTNFEISKTVENLVRQSGEVQKLSIAVLVDGRYETDTAAEKPADAGDDWQAPKKYVPRSQDELDKITSLVKSAVGFDESRGDTLDIVNLQFTESDAGAPLEKDDSFMGKLLQLADSQLLGVIQTISMSIAAVLIALLVLRPLITHMTSGPRSGGGGMSAQDEATLLAGGNPAQAQLAGPQGALPGGEGGGELDSMVDMSSVEGKVKASSVQKISELVTSHPQETVSVIRQWMAQES